VEQQLNGEQQERIDKAAEHYWLQGYHLGYAKRRALADVTRQEMPQPVTLYPVVRL
jgi:hypothetical protein